MPTPGPAVPLPPPPPPPPPVKTFTAQKDLADGIDLYDRGEYAQAITKLSNLPDLSLASIDVQTTALKYLAFSYCVTRRLTLCRTQFDNAFKLDPAFDLKPAERGHPQWGPVFERVKKAQAAVPK